MNRHANPTFDRPCVCMRFRTRRCGNKSHISRAWYFGCHFQVHMNCLAPCVQKRKRMPLFPCQVETIYTHFRVSIYIVRTLMRVKTCWLWNDAHESDVVFAAISRKNTSLSFANAHTCHWRRTCVVRQSRGHLFMYIPDPNPSPLWQLIWPPHLHPYHVPRDLMGEVRSYPWITCSKNTRNAWQLW